jgi:glycerol-3-phosphate dehydrogenase
MGRPWTARVPLPGGDFPVGAAPRLAAELQGRFPFVGARWAARLVRSYGTEAATLLAGARTAEDLGERFGWDLTAREVDWLVEREWARTAEDVLWRRGKLGLRLSAPEAARLAEWMERRSARPPIPVGARGSG